MKNLPLLLGSLAVTIIAVVGVAVFFTKQANAPVKPVDDTLLISHAKHSEGPTDAKATLVEFSDFQCPACGAAEPYVEQILQKYQGKLRFVYRQFPLTSIHHNAAAAARVAEAADKQGKFWQMHDLLFQKQSEWADVLDPTPNFLSYAQVVGLNVDQFKKDVADNVTDAQVTIDEGDGNALGVNATPTFYVNGVQTDLTALQTSIDTALAK
ncbi:disulfide bond formation protein DsbA [Candidatus Cerribacteria bacterium 'Amazon FNV 2010 28 9']|uniref:Disulfide bond formation protein DsbA n=1 Tax=Candidatus Cerribacteria bacterium 'Amazon FNV 2010 28 9' TaxID=2081795 RepID=A0A317JSX9_9BACT|nr:MAG: disulfide bond formation protein DsbA [Candidatus Cerribacteria bacterium 'Amazon FNV 2010 28 9']